MHYKSISIIGLGYIGLPTAAVLASHMGNVIGVDVCQEVVDAVNSGLSKNVESGLAALLDSVRAKGQLKAVTQPEAADAFIIAVPTPTTEAHKPDISYVMAAALSLAPVLSKGNLIILESTSPVGTTEQMAECLAVARPDLSFPAQAGDAADVQIAYCPERILPGKMLEELVNNDRVVGGLSEKASVLAVELYKIFVKGEIVTTNVRTAELCKLTENSFRDVNIAFANEMSMICDKLDVDVWELIKLTNRHPRVDILQPGCGVGGHCIPVDPWFIVDSAPEDARLIRIAREVNAHKVVWVLKKIAQTVADIIRSGVPAQNIKIACFGLTYKANQDDLRESPAVFIVKELAYMYPGCIAAVEPHLASLPDVLLQKSIVKMDAKQALEWATIAITLVGHQQFRPIMYKFEKKLLFIDAVGM